MSNETKQKTSVKAEVPTLPDGKVGIRGTLNNMGFDNDNIGYDASTGYVTLKGKPFMKPDYLDDNAGISYSTNANIQKNLQNFYSKSSNPIVRVSDAYASLGGKYGLTADSLSYGNGMVSIGGKPLDILYIDDDNKAWAWQSDVASAIDDYVGTIGIESPIDLHDQYNKNYLSDIWDYAKSLKDAKDFSYNPDSDPVYLAYKEKYLAEGERATIDAIASYGALTGGYGNSAAITAGAQAAQYYAGQLAGKIPELAEDAYNRYIQKYQSDINLMDKMFEIYNTSYDNASYANRQQLNNSTKAASSNVQRDNDAYQRHRQEWLDAWDSYLNQQKYDQTNFDMDWDEKLNDAKYTQMGYQTEGLILDNQQKEIYRTYYERLLQAELEGKELSNSQKQGRLAIFGY